MAYQCRTCFEDDDRKNLIAPCSCKGGSRYIHRRCLDEWRAQGDEQLRKCGVCHFEYILDEEESNPRKRKVLHKAIAWDMGVFFCGFILVTILFIVLVLLLDFVNIIIKKGGVIFYFLVALFLMALILYIATPTEWRFRYIPIPILMPVAFLASIAFTIGVNACKHINKIYHNSRTNHRERIWQIGPLPMVINFDEEGVEHHVPPHPLDVHNDDHLSPFEEIEGRD
jgi:hypothetical protein